MEKGSNVPQDMRQDVVDGFCEKMNTSIRELLTRCGLPCKVTLLIRLLPEDEGPPKKAPFFTLEEIKQVMNEISNAEIGKDVTDKSTRRNIPVYRQIACKIAADMGYGCVEIGNTFMVHHTSAIYSQKHIRDMLTVKDKKVTGIYNRAMDMLTHKYKVEYEEADGSAEKE